jgi:hypothetical protein
MRGRAAKAGGRWAEQPCCKEVCDGTRCARNGMRSILGMSEMAPHSAAHQPTRFSRAGHTRRRRGSSLHRSSARAAAAARSEPDCKGAANPHRATHGLPIDQSNAPAHAVRTGSIQSTPVAAVCPPCTPSFVADGLQSESITSGRRRGGPSQRPKTSQHSLEQRRLTPAQASIYAGIGPAAAKWGWNVCRSRRRPGRSSGRG